MATQILFTMPIEKLLTDNWHSFPPPHSVLGVPGCPGLKKEKLLTCNSSYNSLSLHVKLPILLVSAWPWLSKQIVAIHARSISPDGNLMDNGSCSYWHRWLASLCEHFELLIKTSVLLPA